MRKVFARRMLAASVSALVLFLGAVPDDLTWQDGLTAIPQAHAAGGKGGHGGGPPAGAGGGHQSDGHDTDGHDADSHDSDSHDHEDGAHESGGGKGKGGSAYRGGRTGTSKGRGGPSHSVVEKVLESE